MDQHLRRQSKFLSLLLRHKPETVGLELDENGWADVETLIELVNESGREWDLQLLQAVVDTNDKQRFRFSDDGTRIRANQGHSVDVDVELREVEPPAVLYHGTADRFLESIRSEGLTSQSRQHVHLSADQQTAVKVGERHGRPVVLQVDAAKMRKDGFVFYLSENKVWLTYHVPAKYLSSP